MRDWRIGRKPREQPLQRPNPNLNQRTIEDALASVNMQIPPQVDVTQFCIKAAASVARAIAERARFSIDDMDNGGKLVTALFGLAASCQLSASLDAPFEVISSVVPRDLFGANYAAELPGIERAFQRLATTSGILKTIEDNIREWIVAPSDLRLERLAAMFVICRRHV